MSNAGRSKSGSKITLGDFLKGIKNRKYLLYALLNFGMVCGIYGFGTWLPSIISAISGSDIFRVSLLALIPYGLAALLVYPWSLWASKTKKLGVFAGLSMVIAAIGLMGAVTFLNTTRSSRCRSCASPPSASTPPCRRSYPCPPISPPARPRPPGWRW